MRRHPTHGPADPTTRRAERPRASAPLRVLMTTDTLGGVWTYALELSSSLAARGVEVALATHGGVPNGRQRAEARAVPGLRLFASGFRCEWMEDPWTDVDGTRTWLRAIEAEVGADVVHLNAFSYATAGFRAPVLVVGHSCVLSWWRAVRGSEAPPRYDAYRRAVTDGIAAADHVVAPTRALLRSLARDYGPLRSASVVPNGRSAARFSGGAKEEVVLACGRLWDDAKNLGALEHAAASLSWPVEVAGPLRHPEGGERVAAHVRCLGTLAPNVVARRMARASILAHPARYEPFGLVPLEAALCGCALVLGDIPTLREVWGDAARFADPEDPGAIAFAIAELIASERARARLARRARERARRLTADAMADAYLGLYREMTRGAAPLPRRDPWRAGRQRGARAIGGGLR